MTTTSNTYMTLKQKLLSILPTGKKRTSVTLNQIMARLNSSKTYRNVVRSTVRGRLSELVASGTVNKYTRENGTRGFFRQ
jgi:hypothetical protein